MLLAVWGMCSSFYITRHDWKKNNDSLEERQSARLDLAAKKFLFRIWVFALKMDKFLVKPKKKPCGITPQEQANQYPRKFHADDNLPFCLTCNVVMDHHRESVLDNHLSAVSHIKRMSESSSKRAKQQTLKTSFTCKTPAQEERVKVFHEWIRACAAANIPLNKSENPINA